MKSVSNRYKEAIRQYGKQIDIIITYTDEDGEHLLDSDVLFSITPTVNGNILKSVMKQLDFESSIKVNKGTLINVKFGVLVDLSLTIKEINEMMVSRLNSLPVNYLSSNLKGFEYIYLGNYIVSEEPEYNADTQSYSHICYDKMLYSMKNYEKLDVTYPITIREYINKVCEYLGLSFKDKNDTFANYDRQIKLDLYDGYDYTFRDVLDELAQVTASTICINENTDELEIRYINNTDSTINEDYLKDTNVTFSEKYGPLNSVVLSRSAESDNVFLRDEDSVENNGLCEIKIIDNQIMNDNDRSDFLPDILSKLNGLEYYINDFSSPGIAWYELCDKYTVKIEDNLYNCVLFNDEIKITQGLEENIYTEIPETSKTDYSKADKTDKKINKAYRIIDKQNQKIEDLLSQQNENSSKISQHTQDIDSITNKISATNDELEQKTSELKQTIDGLNHTLTNAGGNNIFYYAKEFWTGETEDTEKNIEEYTDTDLQQNSISGMGYIINKGTSKQKIQVKNDNYVISFKYKKLVELATGYILLNGTQYNLTATEWAEMVIPETIDTSVVDFEIISDTDNAFEICDLMGSIGTEKQIWTQNPNETRTDTVTIGKGIEVNSSTKNTYARFDADGNRIFNKATNEVVTELTDKGVDTNSVKANVAEMAGILIQKIDGQTWFSSLL